MKAKTEKRLKILEERITTVPMPKRTAIENEALGKAALAEAKAISERMFPKKPEWHPPEEEV